VGIGHFCLAEVYGRQNKLEKAYQSLTIAREIFTACRMDNWLARADAAMAPFQQS
jgi:hypothetical protein